MDCKLLNNYCAHGRTNENGTCFNKFELLLIAEHIETIENRKLNFKKDAELSELWKDLNAYMKSRYSCNNDLCWVETLQLKDIEKKAFKPLMPDDWLKCDKNRAPNNNCMNNWLSNYEIDEVLEQFQQNVDNFEYLGSVPMDFARLSGKKINSINIKSLLEKGKTKIGMVFNTDPSTGPGQHWICAFIDLENKEINFFDSYGSDGKYTYEIQEFFRKVIIQAREIGFELRIKINVVRHQFKNSECGVYCLKFIADRLTSKFEDIVNVPILDEVVNEERWKRFFRVKGCTF